MLRMDVRLSKDKLENLKASTLGLAFRAIGEVTGEAVRIAKDNSRVDTGAMQTGWTRRRVGEGGKAGYRILNSVPYTVYNEFGTYKMSAQPMLGPAMDYVVQELPSRVQRWIEEATRQIVTDDGIIDEGDL